MQLQATSMSLGSSRDRVRIYDGNSAKAALLARLGVETVVLKTPSDIIP